MSKIDLDPITSGYNLSKINANFQKVEDELNNKVLYRNPPAVEPNSMSSNLDMNSRSILNAGKISSNILELGGVQVVPTNLAIDPYNGTREALRRGYAEAGYTLVDGSFEFGGVLASATSVLLHEFTGKAYSGAGPFPQIVPPGSTPVAGFIDQSSSLLKPSVDLLRSDFDDYSHNDTNQRIGNGVLITAHRSGGVGTENSIMNYQKMMETGMYDGIELDMCISADGVLYNFHDRNVSIQTNGAGMFYELNSSYIDTLRYTAMEGTSIAGEQIPKLHEVLRVAADFDCWVNAEIKFMRMDGGVDRYTDIHIMIDALKDAGVFEKCMLGAFNINYLTTAINYDKFSSINRYIFQGEYTNSAVDQLAAIPSKGLKFMSLFYTDFTPAIAEYMRSKGVIPGVWTPNDPMQQETAIADGARIINSDAWGLGNLGGKK